MKKIHILFFILILLIFINTISFADNLVNKEKIINLEVIATNGIEMSERQRNDEKRVIGLGE